MKTSIPIEFIELEKHSYHLVVKASINEHEIRMVLDTGASRSCFDINYLFQMGILPSDNQTEIKSSGLGGNISESSIVLLNNFQIGEFRMLNYKAVSLDLSTVNQAYESVNIDSVHAILGSDVLHFFRAVIRYDQSCLILKTRRPDIFNIKFR